jgi:hypothetical protein
LGGDLVDCEVVTVEGEVAETAAFFFAAFLFLIVREVRAIVIAIDLE